MSSRLIRIGAASLALSLAGLASAAEHATPREARALFDQAVKYLQVNGPDQAWKAFNNRSGQGPRLVISVFVRELVPGGAAPFNQIQLSGILCKTPTLRRTPLGREICDLILAVNRRYGRADYLPCIAWGAGAAGEIKRFHAHQLSEKRSEGKCSGISKPTMDTSSRRLCVP